jgi:hypothetical protein
MQLTSVRQLVVVRYAGFCYPSTKTCPTSTTPFRAASCDCDNNYCPCSGATCTSTLEVNSRFKNLITVNLNSNSTRLKVFKRIFNPYSMRC